MDSSPRRSTSSSRSISAALICLPRPLIRPCARARIEARLAAHLETGEEAGVPVCSLGGTAVAWTPVRLPDGSLCDAQRASLQRPGMDQTPEPEEKLRIEKAIAAELKEPRAELLALEAATPWKLRIPAVGWPTMRPCTD